MLDRAGAFDELKRGDVAQTVRGYGTAMTLVVAEARRSVPSLDRVTAPTRSIFDRLRR